MTLDQLRPGERAIVQAVAGQGANRRLYDLGLLPGTEVEVIASHPFHGPLVVKAQDAVVAVGRGLARRIPVTRIDIKGGRGR